MANTFLSQLAFVLFCSLALQAPLLAATNLIEDASFESTLPLWIEPEEAVAAYAESRLEADATDGESVLAISGWGHRAARFLTPPLALQKGIYSATLKARNMGRHPATVALFLSTPDGGEIECFNVTLAPGREWQQLEGKGRLSSASENYRAVLQVHGVAVSGEELQFDQWGLFLGNEAAEVKDRSVLIEVEAARLAKGSAWKAVPNDRHSRHYDAPSIFPRLLSGSLRQKREEGLVATHHFSIPYPGRYRFLTRFLQAPVEGEFTVALWQEGRKIAESTIATDAKTPYRPSYHYQWQWDELLVDLTAGTLELRLERNPEATSWLSRRIDAFVITNRTDWKPERTDLGAEPLFVRFVNTSSREEPFCLIAQVRRGAGPEWSRTKVLSRATAIKGYIVPADRTQWLGDGEASAWYRISNDLLTTAIKPVNNLFLLATRHSHTRELLKGGVEGWVEFATGKERKIVRRFRVEQEAPRMIFTIPEFDKEPGRSIQSAADHLHESRRAVASLPSFTPPESLGLSMRLNLRAELDPEKLVVGELEVMKRIGINQTYHSVTPPAEAVAFAQSHGLRPSIGVGWAPDRQAVPGNLVEQDIAATEDGALRLAEHWEAALSNVHRIKLADEPSPISRKALSTMPGAAESFRRWLHQQNIEPGLFGKSDWEAISPTHDPEGDPLLYYYTGLYRLSAEAQRFKQASKIYHSRFPNHAKTYVNLVPAFSQTIDQLGIDPFLFYGDGGLDLIWTEDWRGHGVSPQHLSDYLALLRAAGREHSRPLGGYLIGMQHQAPSFRINGYTWLSEGVKHLDIYNYGPFYVGVDSWSPRHDFYPEVAAFTRDAARLDVAMKGAVRRQAEVAIVFNRTASIWGAFGEETEKDARYLHWAITHSGYDADFVSEEQIQAGALARYRVVYLNGVQILPTTAEAIARWVRGGGVLVGTAGAGARDEANRASSILRDIFGISGSSELQVRQKSGEPRVAMRRLKPFAMVTTEPQAGLSSVTIPMLALDEEAQPKPEATIVARRSSGPPAAWISRAGSGWTLRSTFLPGLAYLHDAITEKGFDPIHGLPTAYRKELRQWITWPIRNTGIQPVAVVEDRELVAVIEWESDLYKIYYLIDYSGGLSDFATLRLQSSEHFEKAALASGRQVERLTSPDGATRYKIPIRYADALILTKPNGR